MRSIGIAVIAGMLVLGIMPELTLGFDHGEMPGMVYVEPGRMAGMEYEDREEMAHEGHMNMASEADGIQALFMLSTKEPQPRQDVELIVRIQDQDGNPIDQFDVVHKKKLHMFVVSKDLSYFHHIHPEYKGNGEFKIITQFPTAGEFEVIVDFSPAGVGTIHKSHWFTVQGTAPVQKPIEPDTTFTKKVDGKEVTLTFDHLMANMGLKMNFHIQDAGTNEPVTNLQPYLGAVGHVVVLSQDAREYLHVHPTNEKAKGPEAEFMVSFPHSGVFKIWGQFKQHGKVFTVPFVVKVP